MFACEAQARGDLAVGAALAKGDLAQQAPDILLERRAHRCHRQIENLQPAGKVGLELRLCLIDDRHARPRRQAPRVHGNRLLAEEERAGQVRFGGSQQQIAERAGEGVAIHGGQLERGWGKAGATASSRCQRCMAA